MKEGHQKRIDDGDKWNHLQQRVKDGKQLATSHMWNMRRHFETPST